MAIPKFTIVQNMNNPKNNMLAQILFVILAKIDTIVRRIINTPIMMDDMNKKSRPSELGISREPNNIIVIIMIADDRIIIKKQINRDMFLKFNNRFVVVNSSLFNGWTTCTCWRD